MTKKKHTQHLTETNNEINLKQQNTFYHIFNTRDTHTHKHIFVTITSVPIDLLNWLIVIYVEIEYLINSLIIPFRFFSSSI